MHDVPIFDRFAPFYDYVMVGAETDAIEAGLARATGDVDRVVDLAGGTGRVARELDPEPVVLDASAGMLSRAHERGLPVVRGDARTLPVKANAVDAVVVVDALHHLPDRDRVLRECQRALRPGGVLVVRDFDPSTVRGRLLVTAEHALGFDSTFDEPGGLETAMTAAGFDPTTVERGFTYTVVGRVPGREP